MTRPHLLLAVVALAGPAHLAAPEAVDLDMMTRIREEGFHRSQVMETAATLTDTIGPRLTGSPAQRRAREWTRSRLQEWGLADARLEPWGTFGRGWSLEKHKGQVRGGAVLFLAPSRELVARPKEVLRYSEAQLGGTLRALLPRKPLPKP